MLDLDAQGEADIENEIQTDYESSTVAQVHLLGEGGMSLPARSRQMSDQISQFLCDAGSAAAGTRLPAPIQAKAGAMPANDGLWFDHKEDIGQTRPEAA